MYPCFHFQVDDEEKEEFEVGVLLMLILAGKQETAVTQHFYYNGPKGHFNEHVVFFQNLAKFLGLQVLDTTVDRREVQITVHKGDDFVMHPFSV